MYHLRAASMAVDYYGEFTLQQKNKGLAFRVGRYNNYYSGTFFPHFRKLDALFFKPFEIIECLKVRTLFGEKPL